MGLIIGMDNHDIACADVARMYGFYVHTLGLTPAYHYNDGDEWFAASAGATTLYFFQGKGEHPPRAGRHIDQNRPGLESLTFLVSDLDKAIEAWDGTLDWCGPADRWEHPNGSWFYFRFFYDPEGNKLSLSEAHEVRTGA